MENLMGQWDSNQAIPDLDCGHFCAKSNLNTALILKDIEQESNTVEAAVMTQTSNMSLAHQSLA